MGYQFETHVFVLGRIYYAFKYGKDLPFMFARTSEKGFNFISLTEGRHVFMSRNYYSLEEKKVDGEYHITIKYLRTDVGIHKFLLRGGITLDEFISFSKAKKSVLPLSEEYKRYYWKGKYTEAYKQIIQNTAKKKAGQ